MLTEKSDFENNLPTAVFQSFQPLFFFMLVEYVFFSSTAKTDKAEEIKIYQRKALAFTLSVKFSNWKIYDIGWKNLTQWRLCSSDFQ